ncbi:heavy-metal-associated domain-containing protein [Streptomyces sp. Je 1-79]|uniref:heavy-metal-associated domain-containing protein n=1 Tax=Streptomyces sp. Je 1-79 TaxID=2943847 RepID=UPI0021A26C83|nr:heavy-metal-associated domain-containing protein [Streptomyces sp. Je 1-79]MCT4356850.1 heavy-metal-associated domain-containing protein [Streptomyces sp. Je 1-79]
MGSCCTPGGSCSTEAGGATTVAVADSTTTVYAVSGMTCGHCRTAITDAVSALDGVVSVDVDVTGGLVTVVSGGAPDDAVVSAAVDDAGYRLTGRA